MTLTLNLAPDLEQRLAQAAQRRGMAADAYTLDLLRQHLPAADRGAEAVDLLQTWIDHGDAAEQAHTGNYLVRALDEDRPLERKLFPPELEGMAW
jgi:hypothetical protein